MRPDIDDAEVQALGAGGFIMRDGFLGEEAALAVVAELADLTGFRPAGVARAGHLAPKIRGDELVWLDPAQAPPALALLCRALEACGAAIDEAAYLGLGRCDVQAARYPDAGARYQRHRDALVGGEGRRLSLVYYANPGWRTEDGGVLRVYPRGGGGDGHGSGDRFVDVEPRLDRLVAFLSTELEHEVLPAHAPRLAVTAWFYGRHPLH